MKFPARFRLMTFAGGLLLVMGSVAAGQGVVVEELQEGTLRQDSGGGLTAGPRDSQEVARKNLFAPDSGVYKSRPLAVLYSALVPGLGQWYLGQPRLLRTQLAADGFVLLAFGTLKLVQYQLRQQVRTYLATRGHLQTEGVQVRIQDVVRHLADRDHSPPTHATMDYDSLKIASVWISSDSLRLQAYEPGRIPADQYVPYSWYFNDRADWDEFKKLWGWEQRFGVYAGYSLAGLALNRLVAMVHAFQLGKKKKPRTAAAPGNGYFLATEQDGVPLLCYRRTF
jgi:hypothetical protein